MRKRITFAVACLLVLAAGVLASGCGSKKNPTEPGRLTSFELMLDFFPNADHAPIYAAKAAGRNIVLAAGA